MGNGLRRSPDLLFVSLAPWRARHVNVSKRRAIKCCPQAAYTQTDSAWYFAYGSNLSPERFGPDATPSLSPRRLPFEEAKPAVLENFALEFFDIFADQPALLRTVFSFTGELSFANVKRRPRSQVHGVAFRMKRTDLHGPLALSEGNATILPIQVRLYTGETVFARTFVWDTAGKPRVRPRPSQRYMNLIVSGANHYGLSSDYIKSIRDISGGGGYLPPFLESPMSLIYSPQTQPSKEIRDFARDLDLKAPTRAVRVPQDDKEGRRTLFFLPGLDGTGLGIVPHIGDLAEDYEVFTVVYSQKCASSWSAFVDDVAVALESSLSDRNVSQPPVLVAESLGGALALELASRCSHESLLSTALLMVMNPATSFKNAQMAQQLAKLPFDEAPALFLAALPLLFDMGKAILDTDLQELPRTAVAAARIPSFRKILPPKVLRSRLDYLEELQHDAAWGKSITNPTLLIGSENDLLLPSADEVERLAALLPNALPPVRLADGGHVALLHQSFALGAFLESLTKFAAESQREK